MGATASQVRAHSRDQSVLRAHLDDAIWTVNRFIRFAAEDGIRGRSLLEIGPGVNFGPALLLLGAGAREFHVVEPFPVDWNPDYHPAFYRALHQECGARNLDWDLGPLETVLRDGGYDRVPLHIHTCAAEHMGSIATGSIDLSVSGAVLEHVFDPELVMRELARVTAPGGRAAHGIDCRDHRDPSRPFEYLLASEADFWEAFFERSGECGNRWRPVEFHDAALRYGFAHQATKSTLDVEPAYLEQFLPSLRKAPVERYRTMPTEDLKIGTVELVFERRTDVPAPAGLDIREQNWVRGCEARLRERNTSRRVERLEREFACTGQAEFELPTGSVLAEQGHCFIFRFQTSVGRVFSLTDRYAGLTLYEDGEPLPRGMSSHDEIRTRGEGRYSVWEQNIYFSTSDNSDPRSNGRTYALQLPAPVALLESLDGERIARLGL